MQDTKENNPEFKGNLRIGLKVNNTNIIWQYNFIFFNIIDLMVVVTKGKELVVLEIGGFFL